MSKKQCKEKTAKTHEEEGIGGITDNYVVSSI